MKMPFVSLRSEITRNHAMILMDWLEDERVTRYLSDSDQVSRFIGQAVARVQMPILTHLFNQGGRFFMAHDRDDRPVGFVRLVKTGEDCEIVLVIGDYENWGRRLGASTIREGLKLAFFGMRAQSVIAKIHSENTRSVKGFERSGFRPLRDTPSLRALSMSSGRYFELLREGAMVEAGKIYVTRTDTARLQRLVSRVAECVPVELEHEITRAIIVEPRAVPDDAVTMNSRVVLRLDDEWQEVALVYPQDADEPAGKLSVLSEIGTAILGYQEGDGLDWVVRDRRRHIRIEKVTYQPERVGDLHL